MVFAILVACNSNKQAPELVEGPSPELSAIDSLLWQQPDSALAVLQDYLACRDAMIASPNTPDGDFIETHAMRLYDRHYANLLLSELLYKNDYAQTNRMELLQAVGYFDSLTFTLNDHSSLRRLIAGGDPLSPTRNDQLVFLSARAHYINGVGYYEHDSVVPACQEYLKALEVMEEHFEEEELVGKKAKFMTLSYNRLGDIFSEQFMMETAIDCYKNSYAFCILSPISSYSVSNALYRIGKQFDMKGEMDSAKYYYSQALVNMPDSANLFFRDVVSNQSLLSYQLAHQAEPAIKRLKQMVVMAEDDDEKLTRYLIIGDIFFEESCYDSALLYLEPVLENKKDLVSQIQAAHYLHIIYDSIGNAEKSDECVRFLAQQKKSEGQNKALVSSLESLYQKYLSQKLDKHSEKERAKAFRRAAVTIISIVIVIVLFVIGMTKMKSNRLMKEQQAVTNKMLEETKQRHRIEQAAISGRLKQKNQEVRELQDQIKQQNDKDAAVESTISFDKEPICRLIMERVKEGQFKSQMDCSIYKDFALSKEQLVALHGAANRHFNHFTERLAQAYPDLTKSDLDYCCLYLLGLTDADVAALMQRAYNTVNERNSKLRRIFGCKSTISATLQAIANKTKTTDY
jgi:tetratricopeptide (TPR) repeat protein